MYLEILILLALTVVNGLLAMSELAIVSARPSRLKVMLDQGRSGARPALALRENPGRFLSSVQIGITLVGILSGAVSGATLGTRLALYLQAWGIEADWSRLIGVGAVVVAITYLSLIVGELVPKQIALRDPEAVAIRAAPVMAIVAKVTSPLVWVLDNSGKLLLRLLGQTGGDANQITDAEIRLTMAEAESAGVLKSDEREMIAGVMRVADRSAKALMTPRRDVEQIDLADDPGIILQQARATRRSRLPVRDGSPDEIVGVISVKDILINAEEGNLKPLRELIREAPIVLDMAEAPAVIDSLQQTLVHMALVFDEYGHFQGIVTPMDVLEGITGAFRDEEEDEPSCVERADGTWLVAGWMPVDEFAERVGLPLPPERDYDTVAGLMLEEMGRLPALAETLIHGGFRLEVVDLDGLRIDKVLVSRLE